ncbi:hypothetical protein DL765_010124 [Monosporascus sp. GIB2]|nr:hypothetical protein DL765_010124 [Monosporascus sp. GIB2]
MLPSPAAGGLLSTSTSSSDVNNPAQAPTQAPNTAAPSSASSAAATAAAAAASSASATAGAKRPAATDLQRAPGTGAGAGTTTPSSSKRHATGNRASISGHPIPSPTSSSATSAIPGPPPALGGASSSTSPGAARHRHARSHSHATAPAMSVPTTTPMMPLPQPTSAAPPYQYPAHSTSHPHPHPPYPLPPPVPSPHQHPAQTTITEDQLLGRSPDQLVATILQIQSQHQQYVAHLSAQYENIMQQLSELRASLLVFYGGQVANHQAAMSAITTREPSSSTSSRQMVPPPPLSHPPLSHPQLVSVHTSRPSTSHSRGESSRLPPPSPASHGDPRLAPKPSTQIPATPGPPAYDYRTVSTVEEVWKEYREGMNGQPAIEELDANWGSRWRPEPRGRTWYSRRKVIWDKIKEYMEHGMSEEDAVKEVERLRDGGTINKLIRMLQEEKKEKGGGDNSTNA